MVGLGGKPFGRRGSAAVADAPSTSDPTMRTGIHDLQFPEQIPPRLQRRPEGGQRRYCEELPKLIAAFDLFAIGITHGIGTY
jgi:hypothetical protein